jgi:hypothetical protein
MADDATDVVTDVHWPAVILMAHNRRVTYGYTGANYTDMDYFEFRSGSVIVDPWRCENSAQRSGMTVIHYGNTRQA